MNWGELPGCATGVTSTRDRGNAAISWSFAAERCHQFSSFHPHEDSEKQVLRFRRQDQD